MEPTQKFHHRHFPTFLHWGRHSWNWYRSLRLVEHAVVTVGFLLLVGWGVYFLTLSAPAYFPSGSYVVIPPGSSLKTVGVILEERSVVRSGWTFRQLSRVLGNDRNVPAGVYYFGRKEGLVRVAVRLVSGDFETTPVRITIPEGTTNKDIARILYDKLPNFDRRGFLQAVDGKEGYLFPDTYFFMPSDTTEAILSVFNNAFHTRLSKLVKQIDASEHSELEILTMASILEKEANNEEDRRRIAGVLWYRISIGMPLQVDAVFPYILGKNTFEVTLEDLKFDSPYNTYKYKGLPPGPINNPGLGSITAALTPIPSKYIFFLSDLDGNFHFATTYEQHLSNKKKYLDPYF
ncbi:MAG: Endolytic murein transglycosylase [Candidatus Adlerbacteria bacterium]|nr:Endolytic murein transglycosylase [Candidatus Adlerbacteria bacterium]